MVTKSFSATSQVGRLQRERGVEAARDAAHLQGGGAAPSSRSGAGSTHSGATGCIAGSQNTPVFGSNFASIG